VTASEERKIVSVLFCDIVDSTPLAGERDPEDWRAVVARYFADARAAVEQYGGTVEKFIGDAVMAVFGLPTAHDDDPERAVRAAEAIRAAPPALPDLRVRIGIATGEVIANPAAAEKGEFLVTGEVVNLAARLQGAASAGGVLIDARTHRTVAEIVEATSTEPLALKGFAAPVQGWLVRSLRPPAERPGRIRRAPLLARDEELGLMDVLLQRVIRDRRAAMITVIGEAGVGKSRLFAEFRDRLPPGISVLRGRSLPYGSNVAFSALVDAVKRAADIQDTATLDDARLRLSTFAEAALGPAEDSARSVTHLLQAMGLGSRETPFPITRADLFAALTRLIDALGRKAPLVVGLEDVHWADDDLLDLLDDLTLRPPASSILLVCLARPQLLERRTGWGGGRRNVLSIHLDPLPPEASRRLLDALLQGPTPEEIAATVLARAEGNPFFVEEIVGMLIDDGRLEQRSGRWQLRDAEIRIPDTVQGVIAARLDQLPPREKVTAQDAAVVGRIFWTEPVRRLQGGEPVRDVIRRLEQMDVVQARPWNTIGGDEEFIFRHILIRDVAYNTIPRASRPAKHRVVADWLAAVAGDRPDEFADLIAHHYEQAQAPQEAFAYVIRLADRAYALDTYRAALSHYRRAADLADRFSPAEDKRIHLLVQRGWTLARLAEYAAARSDLVDGRRLAAGAGADEAEVSALLGIAWVEGHQGDYRANTEATQDALAIARRAGTPRLVVDCLLDLGSVYHNLGQVHEGVAAFDEAAEISARIGYERGTVHAMRGLALQDVGRLQDAIAYHRRAAARTREIGERRIEASNLNYLAQALIQSGRPAEARRHAEAARELSIASGDRYREQYARRWVALASLRMGDFGQSIADGEAALALARALRDAEVTGYAAGALAELYAEIGAADLSLQREQEALNAIARVTSMMPGKGMALGGIGTARLHRLDLEGARQVFAEATRSRFALWGPPEGRWGLAYIAARTGDRAEARRYATELKDFAEPREMSGFLARALWILAVTDPARREELLAQAIALARTAGERPLLRSLLAALGSTEAASVTGEIAGSIQEPDHRRVFDTTPPL
jgi:class 3 adenylate cyclase/tetratricopeptide (TPR) repeat protein